MKSDSHLPKKFLFICSNESPLEMMEDAVYFILKALFILKILKFLCWHFGHVEEIAYKVNFKCFDVTTGLTNNYHTHIAQYLTK